MCAGLFDRKAFYILDFIEVFAEVFTAGRTKKVSLSLHCC